MTIKVSNQALGQTVFPAEGLSAKPTGAKNENGSRRLTAEQNQAVFAKKNEGDSVAAAMRQKLFATQQSQVKPQTDQKTESAARWEINGITEETDFQKTVGADESPESVLRRTYDEYAFKAGLTKESAAEFVKERMEANKTENNGNYGIFSSKTGLPYSPNEWKAFQQAGSIVMNPTAADIQALTNFKTADDFRAGEAAADQVSKALELGDRNALAKLLGGADASTELGKALRTVEQRADNPDFQTGFISKLGADKFVKLETMLADSPSYRNLLQKSLSSAASVEPEYAPGVEHEPSLSQQIARKADVETLARLTANDANPMSKDFLVEAGKRATTPGVGWHNVVVVTSGEAVQHEGAAKGANQALAAVGRSPEAAVELLQNENFVKNGLRMSNMNDADAGAGFAQVLRAGTSAQARYAGAEKVEQAIMTVSQSLRDKDYLSPDTTINQNNALIGLSNGRVNATVANAMADVYLNNTEIFSKAAGQPDENIDVLDGEDVREFVAAVQPYYSTKNIKTGATIEDKMAAATAVKYIDLLSKAESTKDIKYITEAANLAETFINGSARANVDNAKGKDARQEKLAKAVAIVTEVVTLNTAKGISEIGADVAGKIVSATSENSIKGSNADNAVEENRNALNRQQTANMSAVVQIYEQAAYDRASGKRSASGDEKKQAGQFLADLREYNESLPQNAKILDQNGRLINPAQMNGRQKSSIAGLFGVGTGLDYSIRLSNRMHDTYERLANTTERQIH